VRKIRADADEKYPFVFTQDEDELSEGRHPFIELTD